MPFADSVALVQLLLEIIEQITRHIAIDEKELTKTSQQPQPQPQSQPQSQIPQPSEDPIRVHSPLQPAEIEAAPTLAKIKCPLIDAESLGFITRVMSLECNEQTQINVSECIKRLSVHPENCSALSKHMISAADTVLKSVVEHLLAFTTQLDTSADPIMALSVFSMDSAPGQKLLRLVKTLLTLGSSPNESSISLLNLQQLWDVLGQILDKFIAKNANTAKGATPIATLLLPVLQLFFVFNSTQLLSKIQNSTQPLRESAISADPSLANFNAFVAKYQSLINESIRHNPALLTGEFQSIILCTPKYLDFENKRVYFRTKLQECRERDHERYMGLRLTIRRSHIFEDSFHQLLHTSNEMKGRTSVHFSGEEGIDAGGLTKEWYQVISKGIISFLQCLINTK